LENVWEEIVTLISVNNILKKWLTQNFTPMKLKVQLVEKCREGLLFNKIDYLHVLFFMVEKWEMSSFLVMDI
jgi:hypothetical protein